MTWRHRWSLLPPLTALSLSLGSGCSTTTAGSVGHGGSSGANQSGGHSGALSLSGNGQEPSPYARCSDADDLRCRKVDCPADSSPSTTSVSGKVYDPAGRVPLYNAVVYVVDPSQLAPLARGAACEECSAHFPRSGVLAVDLTKPDGSFQVTDMPVGDDIPLVIQLGKWRRVVKVKTEACADTPLSVEQTRLPKNSSEGDLPRIAVTTGHSDALECLLKKVGIDEAEFSSDAGVGHVHLYAGFEAAKELRRGADVVPLRTAEELWADADKMLGYDMLLLACEGEDNLWNTPPPSGLPPRTLDMHRAVRAYADSGGRIFGSHWHHRWINSDNVTPDAPYPMVANFASSAGPARSEPDGPDGDVSVSVDASFPKGLAFRDWLLNVGASTTPGELPLFEAEHTVDTVVDSVARRWIYGRDAHTSHNASMVQYFSFTTPIGAPECGRMVFSDVHVSFGGGEYGELPFPERCEVSSDSALSPQEKALEFMLFDLASCIQKEDDAPPMPVTIVK